MSTELSVELLFGREVRDSHNHVLGRITDIWADEGEFVVRYYLVSPARGTYRVLLASMVYEVLRLFRLPLGRPGYIVPWSEMDLSNPLQPRVRLPRSELLGRS
jgi:sporulation protein YlmC with PRC-barrel domain